MRNYVRPSLSLSFFIYPCCFRLLRKLWFDLRMPWKRYVSFFFSFKLALYNKIHSLFSHFSLFHFFLDHVIMFEERKREKNKEKRKKKETHALFPLCSFVFFSIKKVFSGGKREKEREGVAGWFGAVQPVLSPLLISNLFLPSPPVAQVFKSGLFLIVRSG